MYCFISFNAPKLHYICSMKEFRKTKAVTLVLHEFDQANKALSVVYLVKCFQSEMNKTTVYRILERLEQKGLLHSFTGKDGLKWYAKCSHSSNAIDNNSHPHFQCQKCGKSECLSVDLTVPTVPDYNIFSANLLLTGHCKDCIS